MGWRCGILHARNDQGRSNLEATVDLHLANGAQAKLPPPSPDMKLLLCGPPPMISAMKKATDALGYEKPRPVSKLGDQVFCF